MSLYSTLGDIKLICYFLITQIFFATQLKNFTTTIW